jgi:CRP-like cAMP-binding protein
MSTTRIELLQRMPIFGGVRDDVLQCLLDRAQFCKIPARDFFFRQGDQALYMYVLEAGRASVRKTWNGAELELGTLSQGDCFGEMALIDMTARSASVRAETECSAIEISSVNLHGVYEYDVEQFTIIQMNISRELCRRLRMTDERLMRVAAVTQESSSDDELTWPQLLPL